MSWFVFGAGALALAVTGWLAWAMRARDVAAADRSAQNRRIARERLAELAAMHAAGDIDDDTLARERAALEDELALQALDDGAPPARGGPLTRLAAVAAVAAVPAIGLALYLALGSPQAITGAPSGAVAQGGQPEGPHDVEDMLSQLEQRLERHPEEERGWALLARSYLVLGRYDDAVRALKRLRGLVGDRPDVLVSLADALAMSRGGRLAGEPERLIARALEAEPAHPTALWLAGMAAAEQGDNGRALEYWQRVEPLVADDAEALAELHRLMDRARGTPAPAPAPRGAPAQDAGRAVEVRVTVDRGLAADLPPDTPVFVYARAISGPPMPLAVVRRRLADLPLTVRLDDSLAMMPQLRLSAFDEVLVGARVALSGQPVARSGDLQGEVAPVRPGGEPVAVVIDQRVP